MSSRIPKASAAVTEWVRKNHRAIIVVVLIVLVAFVFVSKSSQKFVTANIGDKTFKLEVVDSPAKQRQGLSGREGLSELEGMVFVYPESREVCIWMKDMLFSIDALWLDKNQQIVRVENNLEPTTYPESFCKEAKYVIELDKNSVERLNLKTTDKIVIPNL